ncbi:hypothetical protein GCM10017673_11090 [Streptosporangium violaceochromogenes]|nr:hypothetical protein GCM10017673_11090 [Streptosporangium violaceochromogenes]
MRKLLVSAALVGSALIVPAAALPAAASVQGHAATASAACTYQRSGNHWNCVTPGAFCPKAAHWKYGYAKNTHRRYRCSEYSNGQWRWKRA